jgi:hypothetical protein
VNLRIRDRGFTDELLFGGDYSLVYNNNDIMGKRERASKEPDIGYSNEQPVSKSIQ